MGGSVQHLCHSLQCTWVAATPNERVRVRQASTCLQLVSSPGRVLAARNLLNAILKNVRPLGRNRKFESRLNGDRAYYLCNDNLAVDERPIAWLTTDLVGE